MSADRLTNEAPAAVVALVEAVLAGAALETTAAAAGIAPDELDTAVQTYRAGGIAALEIRHDNAWFQARIRPIDWATAEAVFRTRIGPQLDRLGDSRASWWFLRKHPSWRIRIRTTDHGAVGALLDDLAAVGVIAGWEPGIYEPETAAFGGLSATAIVHELFCADSRGVLAYAGHDQPPIGRRELSLLLLRTLQHHAGLDWFEAADVFDRVAQMRPAPAATESSRVADLAARMRPLLVLPDEARTALFAPDGPLTDACDWETAFADAGRKLGLAAASGRLGRGIRAILAQIVIFHWNRLALPAHAQGILAHAATTAILPGS
ncbi:thiopeptide-type bacteriocin biosynthesis protein [Micromonospora carbonacea]|uniref:thiopeptide-type bacteriocin biosynthesis protein n=1 Tax=Micromonospora carbonacea TaxID=47853 RepID=UPI003710BC25